MSINTDKLAIKKGGREEERSTNVPRFFSTGPGTARFRSILRKSNGRKWWFPTKIPAEEEWFTIDSGSGRKVEPRGSRAATGRLNAPGETSGKSFNYARRFWIKATRLYGARICEAFYIIAPSRGWKIMCRGGESVETMRTMCVRRRCYLLSHSRWESFEGAHLYHCYRVA